MTSKRSKVPTPPTDGKRRFLTVPASAEQAYVIDLAASMLGTTRSAWMLTQCYPAALKIVQEFRGPKAA